MLLDFTVDVNKQLSQILVSMFPFVILKGLKGGWGGGGGNKNGGLRRGKLPGSEIIQRDVFISFCPGKGGLLSKQLSASAGIRA